MVRKVISIAVIAGLMATSAQAALLTNVQGAVTVNHGDGFQPAATGAIIIPGDRVWAGEGSADIVYDNGCVVRVGPAQMVAVLNSSPACNGNASSTGGGLKDGIIEDSGISTGTLVIGGLLIGGGIAGGILLTQHDPASP